MLSRVGTSDCSTLVAAACSRGGSGDVTSTAGAPSSTCSPCSSCAAAAMLAATGLEGQDARCTLTTGGGGPATSPSPLVIKRISPVCDRGRRGLLLRRACAGAAGVDDSTALMLVPVLRSRPALSACSVAAKAASSAGSTPCTSARHLDYDVHNPAAMVTTKNFELACSGLHGRPTAAFIGKTDAATVWCSAARQEHLWERLQAGTRSGWRLTTDIPIGTSLLTGCGAYTREQRHWQHGHRRLQRRQPATCLRRMCQLRSRYIVT